MIVPRVPIKNGIDMRSYLVALTLLAVPITASAADYLAEIVSDVHQAEGMTADQIVRRGLQCIKSASHNASESVEPAVDGNVAYGIVRIEYSHRLVQNIIRARASVVAKEGRFKVSHTDIERYNELAHGYIGVHTGFGGGSDKVREVLVDHAARIVECIVKPPEVAGGAW